MANLQDALDAAKVKPANRTPEQQGLVDRNKGNQKVRNTDHTAKNAQKIHGK